MQQQQETPPAACEKRKKWIGLAPRKKKEKPTQVFRLYSRREQRKTSINKKHGYYGKT